MCKLITYCVITGILFSAHKSPNISVKPVKSVFLAVFAFVALSLVPETHKFDAIRVVFFISLSGMIRLPFNKEIKPANPMTIAMIPFFILFGGYMLHCQINGLPMQFDLRFSSLF